MDNYNYPIGADTADAPWNEEEPEPMPVAIHSTFCLEKDMVVDSYSEEEPDVKDAVYDQKSTPLMLINELKRRLEEEPRQDPGNLKNKQLLMECEDWTEDFAFEEK